MHVEPRLRDKELFGVLQCFAWLAVEAEGAPGERGIGFWPREGTFTSRNIGDCVDALIRFPYIHQSVHDCLRSKSQISIGFVPRRQACTRHTNGGAKHFATVWEYAGDIADHD